jgi:hypothetical protein
VNIENWSILGIDITLRLCYAMDTTLKTPKTEEIQTMTLQLDSAEMQKIARDLVGSEVYANVGSMVEYILEKSNEDNSAPFSYDDINLYPDTSDWEAERLHAFIVDELGDTWEDATGNPWQHEITEEQIAQVRAHISEQIAKWEEEEIDTSEWAADALNDFVQGHYGDTWEDVTGTPWETEEERAERHADEEDAARDYIRDNASPAEVYEWWAVSPWLAARLQERGEIVFDAGGLDVWGRCTTGQAIYMDYEIQQIAKARHEKLEKYA